MILVRGRNVDDRSLDIRMAIDFDFPVDVLVRSSTEFNRRNRMGDQFLIDINTAGKVLYEASDKRVAGKSRGVLRNRKPGVARQKVA